MHYSHTQNSNLLSSNNVHPQHQSVRLLLPAQQLGFPNIPLLQLSNNNIEAFSSFTTRPNFSEPSVLRNQQAVRPVSQTQILSVEANRSGKHRNKFSFKRNATTRSKTGSFSFRDNQIKITQQQESLIGRIREIAVSRRGALPNAAKSEEGVKLWNTLSEIYNITLIGNASTLLPLQLISLSQPPDNRQSPQAVNQNTQRSLENVQVLQAVTNQQGFVIEERQPVRSSNTRVSSSVPPQQPTNNFPSGFDPLNFNIDYSMVNGSSQLYTKEIYDLRSKIEVLQQQKLHLSDRLRFSQQVSSGGQENIEFYRKEISSLRDQITSLQKEQKEISELTNLLKDLTETLRQNEHQLAQARNRINFLQNSNRIHNKFDESNLLAESRTEQLENRITELQLEVNQAQQKLEKAEGYIINMEQERTSMAQEFQMRANQAQALTRDNIELRREIQQLKRELDGFNKVQRLESSNRKDSASNEREEISLNDDVGSLRYDLNKAKAEIQILSARASSGATEYQNIENCYRQAVQSHSKMLEERNALVNHLQLQLNEFKTENERLKEQISRLVQVETHLFNAESYIAYQEERTKAISSSYEARIHEVQANLIKAEEYILNLHKQIGGGTNSIGNSDINDTAKAGESNIVIRK